MKLKEVLDLVGRPRTAMTRTQRRMADTFTTEDFRVRARRRLPTPIFDYIEGGADDEISLRQNRAAITEYSFVPEVLTNVAEVDLSSTIAGVPCRAPIGLAPTGYTRLISQAGEIGAAAAAAAHGIPYCVSTVATTSIERVTAATGTAPWFQLYLLRDRGISRDMVARAAEAGCPVLEVAVDTAVSGNRVRDRRNGLTIPPRLDLAALARIGVKPGYWIDTLVGPSLDFENVRMSEHAGSGFAGGSISQITAQFDPSIGWDDLEEVRVAWKGPLFIKGLISATDAARAASIGIDGVHLSNHGGRQLDRGIAPIQLIEEVRASAPKLAIVVDSGIRSGVDVAVALALGADAAFVGRPYLWALASDGVPGVERLIEIVCAELTRTMQLLGVVTIDELKKKGTQLVRRR